MAGRLGNEEPLHRAGLALGEWLLRVLQRKTQGRVPQWRNLLQLEGGPNHHRKLAQSLQHQAPTLCAWLSPAGTARDRTKARPSGHHELISQCVWYKKSVRPDGDAENFLSLVRQRALAAAPGATGIIAICIVVRQSGFEIRGGCRR